MAVGKGCDKPIFSHMKNLRYLCLLCALAVCTMLPTGCIERPDEVPGPDDTAQGGNKYDYATTRDIPLNLDYARSL